MRVQELVSLLLLAAFCDTMVLGVPEKGDPQITTQRTGKLRRTKPATSKRKARYKVQLLLPESTLEQFLGDRGSAGYQEKARTMSRDIQRLFSKTAGVQRVYNLQFSSYKKPLDEHARVGKPENWQTEIAKPPTSDMEPSNLMVQTAEQYQQPSSAIITQQIDSDASIPHVPTTPEKLPSTTPRATQSLYKTSSTTLDTGTSTETTVTNTRSTKQWKTSVKHLLHKTSSTTMDTGTSPDTTATNARSTKQRKTSVRQNSLHKTSSTTMYTGTSPDTTVTNARSTQTSIPAETTTESDKSVFNVERITKLFKECYSKPTETREYQLLLEPYLDAYTELLSIFTILGPIFSFAGDDAKTKLIEMRQLRQIDIDKNQDNYATFQNMFAYEYSPEGAVAELDGVSTNKWIHRPLKLISGIIKSTLDGKSEKTLGGQVQDIYSEILAPHHPWYVRAAVYLALLSFPSRSALIAKMGRTESPADRQAFADLVSAIDAVYDDVEGLYLKYSSGSQ